MKNNIFKTFAVLLIIFNGSLCFSQKKYTYVDKYKYISNDYGGYVTLNYSKYYNNSNEINLSFWRFRINNFNFGLAGISYQLPQKTVYGNSDFCAFYTGPFGLNKTLYSRSKLNITGNANVSAGYLMIGQNGEGGGLSETFYYGGELTTTFELSNISFDIGYMLSRKELNTKDSDTQEKLSYKNPYNGFFIRLNISLGKDISKVNNTFSRIGSKRVSLPNPRLKIKYDFANSTVESGQNENIVVNIYNNGKGSAEDVWLKINSNNSNVISFQNAYYVGYIPPKSSRDITVPITTSENIYDKKNVKMNFLLEEKDGFKATNSLSLTAIPQKPIFPPNLLIPSSSVQFVDNNNILEASEKASIKFRLQNKGKGNAIGLKLKINPQNYDGIILETEKYIGNLEPEKELELTIPLETNYNTKNGKCKLTFFIQETNGFNSEPIVIEIPTAQFQPPNVLVTDYLISTTNNQSPKLGEPVNLKFSIQNIGQTSAKDVIIDCKVPNNVFFSTKNSFTVSEIKPNELKVFDIEIFANKLYSSNEIPVTIDIKESFGKYAQNKIANISLNTNQSLTSFVLDGQATTHDIKISGLRSDVDINIPEMSTNSPNTYALIIGNEDYSSRQSSFKKEIDVIYAKNDAVTFKTYLIKTYGVPEKNITLQLNATATEIRQGLDKLSKIASLVGNKSDFIIYYAGHGISDNISREPYIIPVDVNASNLDYAVKLTEFTSIFETSPVNRATIILDACFSGFGRNQSLIETRGVRVKPKYSFIPKNTIIISSSSDIEPSHPYNLQNHGLFTYYLLKKVQETDGSVKLNDLFDYLKDNVTIQSVLLKSQQQTPSIIFGIDFNDKWKNFKLVE